MQHFLIKFQVQGLNGSLVAGAKLKLYNTNDSTVGGNFYQVINQTWTEETVTWNNAPAAESTLIASLGAVSPGNWYEVDVSSIITGDGTYSLRVSSTSGNGADYSSKEGAHPPVLEVTTGSGATATPSPTATFTLTPTPSVPNGNVEYIYDGDGNLVKSIIGSVTTYYPGSSYEKRVEGVSETVLKYYFAGSVRIAMRENGAITWLLSDHLGSTSVTAAGAGTLLTSLKYTAYGELRSGNSFTDYQYTGQRNEAEIGLYYYVARFYDPALGRFRDLRAPERSLPPGAFPGERFLREGRGIEIGETSSRLR